MSRKGLLVAMFVLFVTVFGFVVVEAQGPTGTRSPRANVGTAFTYQGQLKNNGVPVNAICDFVFALYDAPSGGSQIGYAVGSPNPITVTNGLFTVQVDFGANVIKGDAAWLFVAFRCPPGSGDFTLLDPLQQLTPAPIALALPGLYTQQNGTSPNVIGGYSGNVISPTVVGGTIGGGGRSTNPNRVWANYATVGGGISNTISGTTATIGGGSSNIANGDTATIGGGRNNTASQIYTTIGGGYNNTASDNLATVSGGQNNNASYSGASIGGGYGNTASGYMSTVPGGSSNLASASYSFAAGFHANAVHPGTFVWADSMGTDFTSIGNDQFIVRAANGVGINTNNPSAGNLTVNGRVIAGGTGIPAGSSEPFTSRGNNSGISMDDRAGGVNPRWVMYPNNGTLYFYNSTGSNVAYINSSGKFTAVGGFSGQCLSSGNFNGTASNACNMDFAESFRSVELTAPGDIVALVQSADNASSVRKSQGAYEDLAIGVVSTNPGLVFDNGATRIAGDNSQLITNDKTVVALVGRVPVKVSMENGAIAIGDPLTSSSTPGVAMKATRAGKIIGYAMEALTNDGLALALIQPGYYLPAAQIETQEQITRLESRLVALEQNVPANNSMNRSDGANNLALIAMGVLLGILVAQKPWRRSEK